MTQRKKDATERREMEPPHSKAAHLPQDVGEAVRFTSENEPRLRAFFWQKQIEAIRIAARGRKQAAEKRWESFSHAQQMVRGELSFPSLVNEEGIGGQNWAPQVSQWADSQWAVYQFSHCRCGNAPATAAH